MSKGFILKVLENVQAESSDLSDQIDAAKDMLQHGYDANETQWAALNDKVKDREAQRASAPGPKTPAGEALEKPTGDPRAHQGERFVSSSEPGTGDNPIGYPGTDQDQDGPGKRNKNVPGVKPTTNKK